MDDGPKENLSQDAPSIYIFKSMDRNVGYRRLKELAENLPNIAQIIESGQTLWLLRESNSQKGMLTVDYIRWDKEKDTWFENSTRMALHPDKGWINASIVDEPNFKEAAASMNKVTSETAEMHQATLQTYLSTLPQKLTIQNRMNPLKQEQAQQGLYTGYVTVEADKRTHKVSVPLIPATTQAITCELSGKVFKKPVVLTTDMTIPREGALPLQLNKGKSYEEAELEKLRILPTQYYVNFVLSKIINRLGCGDNALMNNLSNAWLIDPVMLDTLNDPYILPSSHSLSKETVDGMIASGRTLRCPQTQQPFTKEQAIPNINLDRFIKAWPDCQVLLIDSLEKSSQATKPKL